MPIRAAPGAGFSSENASDLQGYSKAFDPNDPPPEKIEGFWASQMAKAKHPPEPIAHAVRTGRKLQDNFGVGLAAKGVSGPSRVVA
jgi:hypothetical protein